MQYLDLPVDVVFGETNGLTQSQLVEIINKYGKPVPFYIEEYLIKYSGAKPTINGRHCKVSRIDQCYYTGSYIDNISSYEELLEQFKYIGYLSEMAEHFDRGKEYVETEYLFPVASMPNGAVYLATGGKHLHKVFVCDNGDCGICLYASNLSEFYRMLIRFS